MSLVFMAVIMVASVSVVSYEGNFVSQTKKNYNREKALALAEAGINQAVYQLNQTAGSYTGETFTFGNGTVVTRVTDIDSLNKNLEATAYIPNAISPTTQRKVTLKVSVEPSTDALAFHYGVQVGDGGLTMGSGAEVDGNIYSNGSISGAGVSHSTITGDTFVAGAAAATPDQQATASDSDFMFGKTSSQIDAAQGFRPSVGSPLTKVSLLLKKVGQPSNINVHLVSDGGGVPTKTSLSQGALQASLVTTSYGWVDVTFSSPYTVQPETDYWLVLDAGRDSDNYWYWAKDNAAGYARGAAFYTDSWSTGNPGWSAVGGDMAFKIWLGGAPTFIDGVKITGHARANTIVDSEVGGDAYFQVLTDTEVDGVEHSGSPDPALQPFPISDGNVADWKLAAEAGGTIVGDYHPLPGEVMFGPKKITGNLILDNNQILILTGTVWAQGYIDVSNGASIRLHPDYGRNSGVILTDKWMQIGNNGVFSGSGDEDSFLMMVSLANCRGGTQTPDCAANNSAIILHNNVNSTIFYAPDGLIYLNNLVEVKEAAGYMMHLSNNTEVDYESGLANALFSNGPSGAWTAVKGTWQEKP